MKLLDSKCTVVYWGLDSGFSWEIKFDINTGLYEIDSMQNFDDPIQCREDFLRFAEENEIKNYTEDWSNLR